MFPTDIDSVMVFNFDATLELRDQCYIFIELKLKGKEMSGGQEIEFRRLINDHAKIGKPSVFILAEHEQYDTSQPIALSETKVKSYYTADQFIDNKYNSQDLWAKPEKDMTTLEFVNEYLSYFRGTDMEKLRTAYTKMNSYYMIIFIQDNKFYKDNIFTRDLKDVIIIVNNELDGFAINDVLIDNRRIVAKDHLKLQKLDMVISKGFSIAVNEYFSINITKVVV